MLSFHLNFHIMRIVRFLITAVVTLLLIWTLNRPLGNVLPMPLGSFLSPQSGFWQNAESVTNDFNETMTFPQLKGKANVYFDERLVPHVFAENDEDIYFIQGYLHAKFRLFQMDLQTRAAEGRAAEIAGSPAIDHDKEQRRLGMRYAAEHSLREMEQNPQSKSFYDSYTAGVNAFIHSLDQKDLPLEYKLLNFQPEEWTNIRTALHLKMMAKLLASGEYDLAHTNLRSVLSSEQISTLYPQVPDSLMPIVPKGTNFPTPSFQPKYPANADSAYFGTGFTTAAHEQYKPDRSNGSNNWVLAGKKTASGLPILANDPHLELSLPSIWYEMQLSTPTSNCYGVTLPGSPFVIIGFNDSIAWGVTNSGRDVKDYYSIKYKDNLRREYWFNNEWRPTQQRIEEIKVKGASSVFDTVSYTVFGPVFFDGKVGGNVTDQPALAMKWAAHQTGDEGITFYKLNNAGNYNQYVDAIKTFDCPGQNFVFASKSGDIAIWQQGKFPARWHGQGLYVMPGTDSTYWWQDFIPQDQNPHSLNPERGFLESANQRPTDASYPYFIPGGYLTARGIAIEKYLSQMSGATVQDMMNLHNNTFNVTAEDMLPLLLKNVNVAALTPDAVKYYSEVKGWNLMADAASRGQTIYQTWLDSLQQNIWYDEMGMHIGFVNFPTEQTTLELLKKDTTALGFVDDVTTPQYEDLRTIVTGALNKASVLLTEKERERKLQWAKFKDVSIFHLLKAVTPFARTGLNVGGWGNTINAVRKSHGPSWRMIVHMNSPAEAFGVYPGGQSGNPGSRFYDNAVDTWANGKYFLLWMMKPEEKADRRVRWTINFNNG